MIKIPSVSFIAVLAVSIHYFSLHHFILPFPFLASLFSFFVQFFITLTVLALFWHYVIYQQIFIPYRVFEKFYHRVNDNKNNNNNNDNPFLAKISSNNNKNNTKQEELQGFSTSKIEKDHSTQMLLGSFPPDLGKTNEIIHVIFRILDLESCSKYLEKIHQKNQENFLSNDNSDSSMFCSTHSQQISSLKQSLFTALTSYTRFHSVPVCSANQFSLETSWHYIPLIFQNHFQIHFPHNNNNSHIADSKNCFSCGCGSTKKVNNNLFFSNKEEINEYFDKNLLNATFDNTNIKENNSNSNLIPLWRVHLFLTRKNDDNNGNNNKFGVTIIVQTHHAIADGYSLMHVLSGIFFPPFSTISSSTSSSSSKEEKEKEQEEGKIVFIKKLSASNQIWRPKIEFQSVSAFFYSIVDTFKDVVSSFQKILGASSVTDQSTCLYEKEKFELKSKRSVVFLTNISKESLDKVRKKFALKFGKEKITITEMLHALISQTFLQLAGILPDSSSTTTENNNQKKPIRFLIPLSSPIPQEILTNPLFRYDFLCRNYVSFLSVDVMTKPQQQAEKEEEGENQKKLNFFEQQLSHSVEILSCLKNSSIGVVGFFLSDYLFKFLPLPLRQQGVFDLASSHSLVLSSIPAPQFESDGVLPFALDVEAVMSNGMPQMISVGSSSQFSFSLTFNKEKYPKFANINSVFEDVLRCCDLL